MKRILTVLAFAGASSVVVGGAIVAGLLVGMWLGLPVGIVIGLLILTAIPTAFVYFTRYAIGVPRRPGLTLLWILVALFAALLQQLATGRLTASSGSPYTSPAVVAMLAVFAASAATVLVGKDDGD
jgi:hypothetical protein